MKQGQLRVTTTVQYKDAIQALKGASDGRSDHEKAMHYKRILAGLIGEIDFTEKKWEAENGLKRIEKLMALAHKRDAEIARLKGLANTLASHAFLSTQQFGYDAEGLAEALRRLADEIDIGLGKKPDPTDET